MIRRAKRGVPRIPPRLARDRSSQPERESARESVPALKGGARTRAPRGEPRARRRAPERARRQPSARRWSEWALGERAAAAWLAAPAALAAGRAPGHQRPWPPACRGRATPPCRRRCSQRSLCARASMAERCMPLASGRSPATGLWCVHRQRRARSPTTRASRADGCVRPPATRALHPRLPRRRCAASRAPAKRCPRPRPPRPPRSGRKSRAGGTRRRRSRDGVTDGAESGRGGIGEPARRWAAHRAGAAVAAVGTPALRRA